MATRRTSKLPLDPEKDKLTDKERAFVYAYCGSAHMNATEAARAAGYETKSEWSLYALASKTIKKVKVRRAIDDLLDSFNMTEVEVLAQLVSIAKDREQHPPSRVRALELVGKARGMWARERAEDAHQGDEIVTDIRRK